MKINKIKFLNRIFNSILAIFSQFQHFLINLLLPVSWVYSCVYIE